MARNHDPPTVLDMEQEGSAVNGKKSLPTYSLRYKYVGGISCEWQEIMTHLQSDMEQEGSAVNGKNS